MVDAHNAAAGLRSAMTVNALADRGGPGTVLLPDDGTGRSQVNCLGLR